MVTLIELGPDTDTAKCVPFSAGFRQGIFRLRLVFSLGQH